MKIVPARDNFTSEAFGHQDPYNNQFSKTDNSAMSNAIKNGSLDFGDLKSGTSGFSPGMESEKAKQSSPRSPVGRKDRREKEFTQKEVVNKPKSTSPKGELMGNKAAPKVQPESINS